jgi:nicotinate-nucleotide--dimethylbenzimidazole phosphoribosyltransferase
MTGTDLASLVGAVERPDDSVRQAAREHLATCGGSLGRLTELAAWLAAVQGSVPARPPARVRMLLLAGDHGVAAADVSHRPPGATARLLRDTVAGTTAVARLAASLDVGLRPVALSVDDDLAGLPEAVTRHAVGRGSGRVDREDAITRDEAESAFRAGVALVDDEVDAGADLLVVADVGRGAGVPAAALVGLLTRKDASAVTSRGAVIDDPTWMRRCAAVRDAMRRGRPLLADQLGLLATVGGADLAATTGVLLQAAARRTPVVLDGVVTAACALVAQRVAFRAVDWWLPSQRSPEPGHGVALDRLGLEPLLDLGVRQQDGTTALLAVPVVRAAAL